MKNLRTTVLCASIIFCSFYSAAQDQKFIINEPNYNKPRQFDNLPELIPVSIDKLNNFINLKPGVSINTTLSNDTKTASFEGTVVSAVNNYEDKVQKVLIRSTSYNGAILYISKVVTEDGTIKYNGRLMGSFQKGDIFVLELKDGVYVLVKKNFYEVINE